MKMRMPGRTIIIGLAVLGLLLASCAADETAIAATVQARIPLALTATAEAEPTATPYSTYTPHPTLTPYPTATPYAPHTPYPTESPYPTATAYPTFTPPPEEAAVVEGMITSTTVSAAATTTIATGQPAPPPIGDFSVTLLQTLIELREEMLRFIGTIDAALRNRNPAVHCANLVQQYDTIMAYPTFDVSSVDLTLQNAYGNYRAAIDRVNGVGAANNAASNGAIDLIEGCRAFLNNNTQGDLAVIQLNQARLSVDAAAAMLSQNIRLLGGE